MREVVISEYAHERDEQGILVRCIKEKGVALFHQWGLDVIEERDGASSFTVAVVEWPNGQMDTVVPGMVRFTTPAPGDGKGGEVK